MVRTGTINAMGVALCLLSAACFGALGIFGKYAFDDGVNVMTLLVVRFAMAAAVFWVLVLVTNAHGQLTSTRPQVRRRALGLGMFGYTAQAGCYFLALERIDPSLLSLLLYTYPAFVTVSALLLGREQATPQRVSALLAASTGVALVLVGAGVAGSFDAAGALLGLGASVVYTTYILVADTIVEDIEPVPLSTLVLSGATLTLVVVGLALGQIDLTFRSAGWFWLAALALVSTVTAVLCFFAGLRRVGPSGASILSTFEPVVTIGLAFACFGDRLSPVQLGGGAMVLAAVLILQAGGQRREALAAGPAPA